MNIVISYSTYVLYDYSTIMLIKDWIKSKACNPRKYLAMPHTDATDIDVPFSHLLIRSHCLLYFAYNKLP